MKGRRSKQSQEWDTKSPSGEAWNRAADTAAVPVLLGQRRMLTPSVFQKSCGLFRPARPCKSWANRLVILVPGWAGGAGSQKVLLKSLGWRDLMSKHLELQLGANKMLTEEWRDFLKFSVTLLCICECFYFHSYGFPFTWIRKIIQLSTSNYWFHRSYLLPRMWLLKKPNSL